MSIVSQIRALPNPQLALKAKQRCCVLCNNFGVHRHGTTKRKPPPGAADLEFIEMQRMFCSHCRRTYSLYPILMLRRVRASIALLLKLQNPGVTWMDSFNGLGIAWNTLHAWKKLGKALLAKLPILLDTVTSWSELSAHLSRWQYPDFYRR